MDDTWSRKPTASSASKGPSSSSAHVESFEGDSEDNESIFTDVLSPSGHADAQTLACMLQVSMGFVFINIDNVVRYLHIGPGRNRKRLIIWNVKKIVT